MKKFFIWSAVALVVAYALNAIVNSMLDESVFFNNDSQVEFFIVLLIGFWVYQQRNKK